MRKRRVRAVNHWQVLSTKILGSWFCFIQNKTRVAAMFVWTIKAAKHSLTSVERPSYLRSEDKTSRSYDVTLASKFNMWSICTSIVCIRLVWFLVRGFVPLFRSFLDWFQSIQTRRCHCLRLKDVFDVSSLFLLQGEKDLSSCVAAFVRCVLIG